MLKQYKATFFHVEKCAGSSIKTWLKPYTDILYFHTLGKNEREDGNVGPHFSPNHFMQIYGVEEWAKLGFTFASIRNPWERLVSLYLYLKRTPKHAWTRDRNWQKESEYANNLSFAEYIQRHPPPSIQQRICFNGAIMMDYLIRFECLAGDIEILQDILQMEHGPLLTYEKRAPQYHWRDFYTDSLQKWVHDYYYFDCTQLGYTYE
jgi:hypothetical protein